MNAGESVIEEVLRAVESGQDASLVLAKFLKRYPQDIGLRKVFDLYSQYSDSRDDKKLSEAKSRLRNLAASRRMESSGGGDLKLKDRRKFEIQYLKKSEERE